MVEKKRRNGIELTSIQLSRPALQSIFANKRSNETYEEFLIRMSRMYKQ